MRTITDRFERYDFQIYETGAALREELLGGRKKNSRGNSLEFITSAQQDEISKLISSEFGQHPEPLNNKPGYAFQLDGEEGETRVKISPYRNLRGMTAHYFKTRKLTPVEVDLASREITINAIARRPDGRLIDPFHGIDDLKANRLRTIVPPEKVIRSNPLWLLKVPRYLSTFGYTPIASVTNCMEAVAGNVLDLKREWWRGEFERILVGTHVGEALQLMFDTRVLGHMLPEVAVMVGFEKSCDVHHKDIWEHTKEVIGRAKQTPTVRWSALIHDIGKVFTRTVDRGDVHFFRHEEMSAMLFEGIGRRFQLPEENLERIHYVVKNHSRINLYNERWTDSAVRRLITHAGQHLDDLVLLSKADVTTQNPARRERIRALITDLERRIGEIQSKDSYRSPIPKKFGALLMQHFNMKPGPLIGELREFLEQALNEGRLEGDQEPEAYVEWLAEHAQHLLEPLASQTPAA